MNILFLTPRDSKTNLGGVEGHVRLLTEELVRRGHEVKELALDGLYKGPTLPWQGRTLGYKFRAWIFLWDRKELFRWAEVVHVHDVFWWYAPFAIINKGLALLWQQGQALVSVTFHGWERVYPPSRSAVIQKRLADFLSDGTIGVGSFYEKWYGVKPDRVVWGVVDQKIDGLYKGPTLLWQGRTLRTLVFLGRLEEVNGMKIVLRALKVGPWRTLRSDLFRCIFVGEGSYRREAEKFGRVTGMVKNPLKYLVDADVVIASSYMSMLEAAAMGKPIIAIANNELKMDYLTTHPLRKWIKVVKNAEELIEEIRGLYKGPTLLQQQDRTLKNASRWAIRQTPERLADTYESLWGIK